MEKYVNVEALPAAIIYDDEEGKGAKLGDLAGELDDSASSGDSQRDETLMSPSKVAQTTSPFMFHSIPQQTPFGGDAVDWDVDNDEV
jgi:hypothetical protein